MVRHQKESQELNQKASKKRTSTLDRIQNFPRRKWITAEPRFLAENSSAIIMLEFGTEITDLVFSVKLHWSYFSLKSLMTRDD